MRKLFDRAPVLDCDCFVADYTNQTNSRKGVAISLVPFGDIPYFTLKKLNRSQKMPYLAVNLEEYPAFISGIENCECVFSSMSDGRRPWMLFLETKYCEPQNIENHAVKACSQMICTLEKLEKTGVADRNGRRVFFAYSVPGRDEMVPFGAFTLSQDASLNLNEQGITVFGYNTVLIATPAHLFVPKRTV